ncbi:hypothetical protein DM860_011101 [Cuscuta australis]|uniref:HTH OST-type domain-containing protein n=1 Tax=Cuscuta australis TaxID=267555 RepID=A0A328E4T1_9ASTE|nr:hypothetical protein DM860_011101 [Cuscuta australis]
MKPLFHKPIFTLVFHTPIPGRKLLQVAHLSTATSLSSHHSPYQHRRNEEDVRNVKVSVWWDFENCALPSGVNVFRVAYSITAAVRASGIKGPIQITAFGDVVQLPRANQEALSSTGINLTHIPSGGKSSAERSLLVDLMYWVSQNPPPAHLFLISGDTGFAGVLHRLRMNNYNILLATPENTSSSLTSAASIMWQWNALLRGEDLTGKHFNHPPDGPYGSWYGHFKAPLEDPFAVMESLQSKDPSSDSDSDLKPRPIPKAVMKYIRHILSLNPQGILITDLRAELSKSSLSIDKDFYGYKKFSRFLLSMPHILKLQPSGSQFLVLGVVSKSPAQNECGSVGIAVDPIAIVTESESVMSKNNIRSSSSESSNRIVLPSPYSVPKVDTPSQKVQAPTTKVQCTLPKVQSSALEQPATNTIHEPPPSGVKVKKCEATESQLHTTEDSSSPVQSQGIFRGFQKWWYGSEEKNSNSSDEIIPAEPPIKESDVKSASQSENITSSVPSLRSRDEKNMEEKYAAESQSVVDKSSRETGFFSKIKSWFRTWKSPPLQDNTNLLSGKNETEDKAGPETHKVFSKDSFWKDMEAFLDTKQGSTLVLQSRTRLEMSQNLKDCGPSCIRSLCESDLLRLVELLITDKRWVEERIHKTFPFKVSRPAMKAMVSNASSNSSTGLSSLFQPTNPPTTNSSKLQEHNGENKKHQNPPLSGSVPEPVSEEGSFGKKKSRNDTLTDCMKLVQYVVKEYPEGYNLGSFRKLFLETHGYSLDVQKLGYPKLVNLLNIMPGIRIESNHIIPAAHELDYKESSSESQDSKPLMDVSRKKVDDGVVVVDYSQWADELGPISTKKNKKKNEMEYEPLSDDDFSDLDEEKKMKAEKCSGGKDRVNKAEEESSLLQILDSWYGRKEENSDGDGGVIECSASKLPPPPQTSAPLPHPSNTDTITVSKNSSGGKRGCKMGLKSYSFVSDHQPGDCKDGLIDGILSSLNKSGDKSVAAPKT